MNTRRREGWKTYGYLDRKGIIYSYYHINRTGRLTLEHDVEDTETCYVCNPEHVQSLELEPTKAS